VSLNDLYKGKVSKLALSKQVLCEACGGVGGKKGSAKYVARRRGNAPAVERQH